MRSFKNFKTHNGYPILFIGKCGDHPSQTKLGEMFWGHNDPEYNNHADAIAMHDFTAHGIRPKDYKHGSSLADKLAHHYQFPDPNHHEAIKHYSATEGLVVNSRILRQHGIVNAKDNAQGGVSDYHKWDTEKQRVRHVEKHLPDALRQHKTPQDIHVFSGLSFTPEHDVHKRGIFHLPAYTSTSISEGIAHGFGRVVDNSNHIYHAKTYQQIPARQHKAIEDRFKGSQEFLTRPENYRNTYNVEAGKAHQSDFGPEFEHHYNTFNKYRRTRLDANKYRHTIRIHVPKGSHGAYVGHMSEFPEEKEFILHKNAMVKIHHQPEINHARKQVVWHAKLIHDGVAKTRHYDES